MEPHYGGWMHGRTHGFRSIEGVAINHDINHLTVLGWDQMQPFMNDTFDWPQWDALNVSDSGVIEYFQSMVSLGDPVGLNLEYDSDPITPPATEIPSDPAMPPMDDNEDHDQGGRLRSLMPHFNSLRRRPASACWWIPRPDSPMSRIKGVSRF